MIRRINLNAGAGCGKSTTAARLYGELSAEGYQVEHISEFVKEWAFLKRNPVSFDQVYIFAKQIHREDVRLRYVKQVIAECPILLSVVYAKYYGFKHWKEILNLVLKFEETFPSLNIILDRKGIEYDEKGRYQSLKESQDVDNLVMEMVYNYMPPSSIHIMPAIDFESIKTLVKTIIEQSQGGS